MRNYLILVIIVLYSGATLATLFQPISLKKHIHESSGIVEGEVMSIEPELDSNGKIVTRVTIKANKWLGQLDIEDDEVALFYPGGQVGSQVRKIEGTPKFSLGESVVVFIREQESTSWISNLGLGKYSIKRMGNEKIMVNQIFPTEPNMGQISLSKFYALAKEVKNKKFSYRFKEKYEIYNEEEVIKSKKKSISGRAIASIQTEEKTEEGKIHPFWLVLLLGTLGLLVGVIKKRNS